jgi:hypothetical protein
MEYYTAPSYQNWERIGKPFDKKGKLYTKVKSICDRCVKGVYVCRVENGVPVPHPAYGGVCLQCGGRGYLTKEVRLYTKAEHDSNERARLRREQQKKERELAEASAKRAAWLKANNFSEDGVTYIIVGETYSIKDQLKADGFLYHPILKWHRSNAEGYEDKVIELKIEEVVKFSPIGSAFFIDNAMDKVNKMIAGTQSNEESNWVGEIRDELPPTEITLIKKTNFSGAYGNTNVFSFKDKEGNIFTWFTTSNALIGKSIDDTFKIKGIIKNHTEYNNVKQTVLTRVKVVEE